MQVGTRRFLNRADAGRQLADKLAAYSHRPKSLVLGLPRGGVVVAYEVARSLQIPLDVFVVRKLGVPSQRELAFGAIAAGGTSFYDSELIQAVGITDEEIERIAKEERAEAERQDRLYRGRVSMRDVRGWTVLVVDDGLATGSTMHAAVSALRSVNPRHLVVAVPVAPPSVLEGFRKIADEVVCLLSPEDFMAVGSWYEDFSQTPDEEVISLLEQAAKLSVLKEAQGG